MSDPLLEEFDQLQALRQRELEELRRESVKQPGLKKVLRDTERQYKKDPFGRDAVEAFMAAEKRWEQEERERRKPAGNVVVSPEMEALAEASAKASVMRRVSWILSKELKDLGHDVAPEVLSEAFERSSLDARKMWTCEAHLKWIGEMERAVRQRELATGGRTGGRSI